MNVNQGWTRRWVDRTARPVGLRGRRPAPALVLAASLLAGVGVAVLGPIALAESTPTHSVFVAVSPYRLFDTRSASNAPQGPVAGDISFDVQVTGTPASSPMPSDAKAVVVSLTYVDGAGPGYVTAWPTGQTLPMVSNLNKIGPGPVPNLATVTIGVGGKISIFNQASAANIFGDVAGYYVPGTGGGSGPAGPPGASGSGLPGSPCTIGAVTGSVGYDAEFESLECQSGVVGNMQVDLGEQCDDGNAISGDGCSAAGNREAPIKPAVLAGSASVGNIAGNPSPSLAFIGTTQTVSIHAGSRLVGAASAALGVTAGTVDVNFALCYRIGMGTVTPFATAPFYNITGPRQPVSADMRSAVFPSPTTLTVGVCVANFFSLTANDVATWWVTEVVS